MKKSLFTTSPGKSTMQIVVFIVFSLFTVHGSRFGVHPTLCFGQAEMELIDRVVAVVDNNAITLSALRENYEKTKKAQPEITMAEVLQTMVSRLLLLNDAKRLKFEAKTDEEMMNLYIEMKVKAFVQVKEAEMEEYYRQHEKELKDAPYESVRDKIEEVLTEKEINRLLKQHVEELRKKAYVKIELDEDERAK
jgi:hypothetical protein